MFSNLRIIRGLEREIRKRSLKIVTQLVRIEYTKNYVRIHVHALRIIEMTKIAHNKSKVVRSYA